MLHLVFFFFSSRLAGDIQKYIIGCRRLGIGPGKKKKSSASDPDKLLLGATEAQIQTAGFSSRRRGLV